MKTPPLSILIVDDWPDAAETLGALLGCYGHAIHVAHDGTSALEAIRKHQPHVVLLDVAMPRISGLDVAKMIDEQGETRPLLIAISGFSRKEDQAIALRAGFDHFFAKPVEINNLLRVLEEFGNDSFVVKWNKDSTPRHLVRV